MCCTCTELSVLCSCPFLPQALWGWGWFNFPSQPRWGFGSNTLSLHTAVGPVCASAAPRVPALLGMLALSLKWCLWLPMKGGNIQGQVSGGLGRRGSTESLALPSQAVFRRRPHLFPWQAQGDSPARTDTTRSWESSCLIWWDQATMGFARAGRAGGWWLKSPHAAEAEPSLPSRNHTGHFHPLLEHCPFFPRVWPRSLPTVWSTLSRAFSNFSWCVLCSLCPAPSRAHISPWNCIDDFRQNQCFLEKIAGEEPGCS